MQISREDSFVLDLGPGISASEDLNVERILEFLRILS